MPKTVYILRPAPYELEDCPKCGGSDGIVVSRVINAGPGNPPWRIICQNCGHAAPYELTSFEACQRWNAEINFPTAKPNDGKINWRMTADGPVYEDDEEVG